MTSVDRRAMYSKCFVDNAVLGGRRARRFTALAVAVDLLRKCVA